MTYRKYRASPNEKYRSAFEMVSEIFVAGGLIEVEGGKAKLSRIPRKDWGRYQSSLTTLNNEVVDIVSGGPMREAMVGRLDVSLAALKSTDGIDVAAILVSGRSRIIKTLAVRTDQPDWRVALAGFTDWSVVRGIISTAEGNDQRAVLGAILAASGVGKGKLEMLEVQLNPNADDSGKLLKGSEWLQSGISRFTSASAEALWYLLRIRHLHVKATTIKKQGAYTALAVNAMRSKGVAFATIADTLNISETLAGALLWPDHNTSEDRPATQDWRSIGGGSYLPFLAGRVATSQKIRKMLGEGAGLIEISKELNLTMRDLTTIIVGAHSVVEGDRNRFLDTYVTQEDLLKSIR